MSGLRVRFSRSTITRAPIGGPAAKVVEILIQLRGGAEEQFAFQPQHHQLAAAGVVRPALADDALAKLTISSLASKSRRPRHE